MSKERRELQTRNIVPFPLSTQEVARFSRAELRTLMAAADDFEADLGLAVGLYDVDELGQFATFSRVGESSSSWGLSRRERLLTLWNSRTGVDVCSHADIGAIFAWLEDAVGCARPRSLGSVPPAESAEKTAVICLQVERQRRNLPAALMATYRPAELASAG